MRLRAFSRRGRGSESQKIWTVLQVLYTAS